MTTYDYDKQGRKWIVLSSLDEGCARSDCIHYGTGSPSCISCSHTRGPYEGRKDAQEIQDRIFDDMMATPARGGEEKRLAREVGFSQGESINVNYETKRHKPRREFKPWWED